MIKIYIMNIIIFIIYIIMRIIYIIIYYEIYYEYYEDRYPRKKRDFFVDQVFYNSKKKKMPRAFI